MGDRLVRMGSWPALGRHRLSFTAIDIEQLVTAVVVSTSLLLGVLGAALRWGVRPLIADWVNLRNQPGRAALEQRVAQMEEEIRQLKASVGLQLPADLLRAASPRT
jgi:hypothetical protein